MSGCLPARTSSTSSSFAAVVRHLSSLPLSAGISTICGEMPGATIPFMCCLPSASAPCGLPADRFGPSASARLRAARGCVYPRILKAVSSGHTCTEATRAPGERVLENCVPTQNTLQVHELPRPFGSSHVNYSYMAVCASEVQRGSCCGVCFLVHSGFLCRLGAPRVAQMCYPAPVPR